MDFILETRGPTCVPLRDLDRSCSKNHYYGSKKGNRWVVVEEPVTRLFRQWSVLSTRGSFWQVPRQLYGILCLAIFCGISIHNP